MLAYPDPSTFQVLPWRPESNAVARMFCSIKMPDGSPFEGDPRHVLARVVQKAADRGYLFNVGPAPRHGAHPGEDGHTGGVLAP